MLLSTTIDQLNSKLGDEGAVKLLKDAGFDAYDYCFYWHKPEEDAVLREDFRKYFENLKEYADSLGIVCNQAHARFSTSRYGEDEWNKKQYELILRDIEAASILGAKAIVVHPVHTNYPFEGMYERNMEFYSGLIPYCEKFGIKVALENMWHTDPKRGYIIADACNGAENFVKYFDGLNNSKCFTACLDLGHSALVGEEPQDAIRILGKRIGALHVHDVNYVRDCHTLPFLEKLEWDKIVTALAEVGYDGDLTFEANNFFAGFPNELLPDAAKLMASVGRYLIKEIAEKKKEIKL